MEKIDLIQLILVLGIVSLGYLIVQFLVDAGKAGDKNAPHALGLPQGSVRAVLSISLIVFFILSALFFYLDIKDKDNKGDLAEGTITILGTLVIAVSSFYFGIKATEQGNKIAQETFRKASNPSYQNDQYNIPAHIILEAIHQNRKPWMEQHKCYDIKLGKKHAGTAQFDLNCICFLVDPKQYPDQDYTVIPTIIAFKHQGAEYHIPTDVRDIDQYTVSQMNKPKSHPKPSLDTISYAITEYGDEWKERYNAHTVSAGLKKVDGKTTTIPAIRFSVIQKENVPAKGQAIPKELIYQNMRLATDVIQDSIASFSGDTVQPGEGVRRILPNSARGTLGMKVYRQDQYGNKTDYILSCYHVFCSPEFKKPVLRWSNAQGEGPEILANDTGKELAVIEEGVLSEYLDASIAKIKDGVDIDETLKGYIKTPRYGYKKISNDDVLNRIQCYTHGDSTKTTNGYISARKDDVSVKDGYGRLYKFYDVIIAEMNVGKGDSGAMVVDAYGKVIGIVFAASENRAFIMPIARIIREFKIHIYHA